MAYHDTHFIIGSIAASLHSTDDRCHSHWSCVQLSSSLPGPLCSMTDPPEREISPGIFVTDFRTAAAIAATQQPPPQEQKQQPTAHSQPSSTPEHKHALPSPPTPHADLSDLNQLSFDLHQLQNSIDHLIASNAEMVTAMEEEAAEGKPEDDEYASAIRENMLLIDRKQSEAIELQTLIDSMLSGHALSRSAGAVSGGVSSSTTSSASLSSAGSSSSGQDEDGMYL